MDYQTAVKQYTSLRAEITAIEKDAKTRVAEVKQKMALLEQWITERAEQDGLENIKTTNGTAYWSTHYTCTVAEPESFFCFVQEEEAWDLIEKRASKTAVKAYIDEQGETPPGVNFSSYRAFNVRAAS
jgi:transcriptional regulator